MQRTSFWLALAGLSTIWLGAAAALAQSQSQPSAQPILYAPSGGAVLATDGPTIYSSNDPSFITKAPATLPQTDNVRRIPAKFAAQDGALMPSSPPPTPPPGVANATDKGPASPDSTGSASSSAPANGANCSSCNTCNSSGCSSSSGTCASTEASCNASPSCNASTSCNGCNSCNSCGCGSCGCDTCTDCNGCCHEKLPHLLHCDCKLHPFFCCHECCPLQCDDNPPKGLFDCCCLKEHGATLTGWLDAGFEGNTDNPASHYNGPVTFPDRDEGQFNQAYVALERTAPANNCGWFLGGRVDLLYGSDYFFTTAAGLDGSPSGNLPRWGNDTFQYGLAMPQLYAETDLDDLKLKWGHFYTIIGYEVVTAKDNFFYSHSYTMQYGEPFTHTGVLATRPINDNWSWSMGLTSGWNDFDFVDGLNFIGGITYTDKDYGSLAFSIVSGNNSTLNLPGVGPDANRTMYSLVWNRTLTSRWTYVLQHDLGVQQDAATLTGSNTATWYGINQYLFYKINCCWTAGVRAEWFRDNDGFAVTGLRPGNPLVGDFFAGNFYEVTAGVNYKPNGNWDIRPEIRYDWFNGVGSGGAKPFDDTTKDHQLLVGVDAILQF